jgi:peroxiredoxin
MKNKLFAVVAAMSLLVIGQNTFAAETNTVKAELGTIVSKIQTKLQEARKGEKEITEKDLEPEMKEFDALLAKHKGEKTDDVANVLYMKATLYLQVLDNSEKGIAAMKQLKRDFPDTKMGKNADATIANIEKQAKAHAEAKKAKESLKTGAPFPDFNEKDLDGKPLSIANYKGKVVLVDFWATWCGPCRTELPNVIKSYEKHHKDGFEIVGISLDSDKSKLTTFLTDRNMTWPQYFDGKGWENKLAQKYGVQSIPATYLIDRDGKIIGSNLRGEDLEEAVTKALAKK